MASRSVAMDSSMRTSMDEIGGTNLTTKKPATETGTFLGEFPYVRLGRRAGEPGDPARA